MKHSPCSDPPQRPRGTRLTALVTVAVLLIQSVPFPTSAAERPVDARVYLIDGSVVMGQLLENSDLVIVRGEDGEIYTFEADQVKNLVTLGSLGGEARTVTETEFPYISFLGGTFVFGLLAWLQFDTASDRNQSADDNETAALTSLDSIARAALQARANQVRDKADRARLLGWSSTLLAVGSLGAALIPRQRTRRVFPAISYETGSPTLMLVYRRPL